MHNLLIASLNFVHQSSFKDAAHTFIAERSPVWEFIEQNWCDISKWLSQPEVITIIMAWWITFTLVMTILMTLGFGPGGIVSGSIAAGFQSWMYKGFTPAAGVFATLTSVGMLGIAIPVFTIIASLVSTIVAFLTWAHGRG